MNSYAFAQAILKIISLKKIFIWSLTALLLTIGITVYEHRDQFVPGDSKKIILNAAQEPFTVSTESEKKLVAFVRENKKIIGLSVLSANMLKNTRTRVYFYVDVFSNKTHASALQSTLSGPKVLPLFSSNTVNNHHMVKLLNGEFACAPHKTALMMEGEEVIVHNFEDMQICRAGLPPYSGDFSGWIAIFFSTAPTKEELYSLKVLSEELTNSIYTRDILPKP